MTAIRASRVRFIASLAVLLFAAVTAPASAQAADTVAEAEWWRPYEELPGGVHILPVDSAYVFEADQEREIQLNLQAFGPSIDGTRRFAQHSATWNFHVTWERPGPGLCQPSDLRIIARSVITMPQLADVEALDPDLRAKWDRFHTALRIHELGHRNILDQHLVQLREIILSQPAMMCDLFAGVFEELNTVEGDRLRAKQDGYDQETESGRTQGAVWPPPRRQD